MGSGVGVGREDREWGGKMLQNGELTDSPLRMVPTAHGASDAGGQRMTYEREYVLPRILEEASLVDQQEGREATLRAGLRGKQGQIHANRQLLWGEGSHLRGTHRTTRATSQVCSQDQSVRCAHQLE